jgi:hypothetical protein
MNIPFQSAKSRVLIIACLTVSVDVLTYGAGNPDPYSDDFYVAPPGIDVRDTNSGEITSPLPLWKAKELAVRRSTAPGVGPAGVRIIMRGGDYELLPLSSTPTAAGLTFSATDWSPGASHSRITLTRYGAEQPVLYGAVTFISTSANTPNVGSWTQVTLPAAYDGGVDGAFVPNPSTPTRPSTVYKLTFQGDLKTKLAERIAWLRYSLINNGKFPVSDLYIDDVRQTRSRHPNKAGFPADTTPFNGANPSQQTPMVRIDPAYLDSDPGAARNFSSFDLHNYQATEVIFSRIFHQARAPLTSIGMTNDLQKAKLWLGTMVADSTVNPNIEDNLAEVHNAPNLPPGEDIYNRGWLENNLSFLDSGGEWYLYAGDPYYDNEIALYYCPRPGETMDSLFNKRFAFPFTYTLISLNGLYQTNPDGTATIRPLTGITIDGLELKHTAWKYENNRGTSNYHNFIHAGYGLTGVIDGNYLEDIAIQNCRIHSFGANGIALSGDRKNFMGLKDETNYNEQPRSFVRNTVIASNVIEDGGGGGIRIDYHPKRTPDRIFPLDHNTVTFNTVRRTGLVFHSSVGILVPRGFDTFISYNTVESMPYMGISVGAACWRTNATTDPYREHLRVKWNTIRNCMEYLIDGGGIHTFGGRFTAVNENTIQNIGIRRPDAVKRPYTFVYNGQNNAWSDIYLDNVSYQHTVVGNTMSGTIHFKADGHYISGNGSAFLLQSDWRRPYEQCPKSTEQCCGNGSY